eukprot:TRINITY_DN1467_c1_g1_i1.p1 TRINITY_DN1467_c1_g1~~TRINITY_DN1467_c1_g1_i1.p1  ORF type:complete len:625 (-),score=138.02 TRINITY_DN1467_c1_g1_i1:426-2300(-)
MALRGALFRLSYVSEIQTIKAFRWPSSRFASTQHGLSHANQHYTSMGLLFRSIRPFSSTTKPTRVTLLPSPKIRFQNRLYSESPKPDLTKEQSAQVSKWSTKISGFWHSTKAFLVELWMATKLFWADTKAATSILVRMTEGNQLTRRERQQLVRAVGDVFRLVPLIVIVVVPFLEFALPFLLKIFPNLLPSQYQGLLQKEEEKKKVLQAKLHVAQFLQDTMIEMSTELGKRRLGPMKTQAEEFHNFIERIHQGQPVEVRQILHFSQLFKDEFTLDKLPSRQISALGQYLGIKPIGTDNFIRFQIRTKIRHIKRDDKEIKEEGINSLTLDELKAACSTRGMKTEGVSKAFMRQQLSDWIDLSLNHNLPTSMLVMSQVFMLNSKEDAGEALKATVQSLPKELVSTMKQNMSAESGQAPDTTTHYEEKLELLHQESRMIEEERKETEMRRQAAAAGKELPPSTTIASIVDEDELKGPESTEQIVEALSSLMRPESSIVHEKKAVQELKRNQEELEESLNNSVLDAVLDDKEWKPADRLSERLSRILLKLQSELDQTAEKIGDNLHVLDTNRDGVISREEFETVVKHLKKTYTPEEIETALKELDKDNDGKITLADFEDTLEELRKRP